MLAKPIKVNVEKHTWVEIPDNMEFYYMDSLFKKMFLKGLE